MKNFRSIIIICCLIGTTGWIIISALIGTTGWGMQGDKEIREISDYLESRYDSRDFEIQKEERDGTVSYRVTPTGYPEAAFTVEEGKIEESMDWGYHDDYAAQMLYGGAERLGLSYEKGKDEYNVFIFYEDYSSLDSVADKIVKLVSDCMESRAFEKLRASCLIVIKPEGETNPDFPGYQVRIETLYTYRVAKRFGVMASKMTPEQFKEDLRLCHLYNAYNYTILKDEYLFSEADVERYKAMCTGAMGEEKNGNTAVYDMVDGDGNNLSFGGAYQILSAEGLVEETAGESFVASGNGMTVKFTREFEDRKPAVSYELLSGDGKIEKQYSKKDSRSAVRALTNKTITFSTPEKKAAAKEEERQKRLPEIQAAFENAVEPGRTETAGGIEVTLLDMEIYEQLKRGFFSVESNEKTVWTRIRLRLENTGDMDIWIIPLVAVPDSDDFFGVIADKEANLYRPIDIVNLGLENIYHEKLLAGETIEGDIYFQLPRDLVAKESSLVLYCSCGSDTAPLFIPSRQ